LDLDDASLAGGNHRFSGESVDGLINLGTISAAEGGYIALLGNNVTNQGVISARSGTLTLGAGTTQTIRITTTRPHFGGPTALVHPPGEWPARPRSVAGA